MYGYYTLVRDKALRIILGRNDTGMYYIANDEQFRDALFSRMDYTVRKFEKNQTIEEFAELQDILSTLSKHLGFLPCDLKKIQAIKRKKQGGFKKRIILVQTTNRYHDDV